MVSSPPERTEHGFIRPLLIEDEMRESYMDYAMSVIVARALPDVRDGLKPVQRRILYAMHDLGMRPTTAYKKSARLVGEVLGKYHPHSDSPVYEAMVRMAQPFSMRLPLVDGQGNFGSVDNDPPAAMRYTEARLSRVAQEMLSNLEQETVDFKDNFDGSIQEPTVLPARLPNLLVNGGSGIAVGMATNIPPHNPVEICNAIIRLIDDPELTTQSLMRSVKAPDFPTGGTIMGLDAVREAFETGQGHITLRGKTHIEDVPRGSRSRIIIDELPYQVNKAALVEKIAGLAKTRRLEGISDIRDESDRDGMRVVIELRSGAQPRVVLNNLHKLTPLQTTFAVNMVALVNGMPQVLTLKAAIGHFIDFRREVITRRSEFELRKAKERAHILEGLRIALEFLDEVIQLIRNSDDVDSARQGLISNFNLDTLQAQAILDMQLRRISALEREKIENEYQELQQTIKELEELLASPQLVLAEVKKETEELKKKVRNKRRTDISFEDHDLSREDYEPHEQIVVTLSRGGYVKRILANTYRNQHRGGKGVLSMVTREDDPVDHILVLDTHDALLFFTDKGRVLPLKGYELRPDTSRNTRGVPVVNVIPLQPDEQVKALISVETLKQSDRFLLMATRRGLVKRLSLDAIANVRRAGLIVMNLKDGDDLVSATLCNEEDDLVMVTQNGQSIRFPAVEITPHQRGAGGIKGITLRDGDRVVAMDVVVPDGRLLVVSRNGYGKLTQLRFYRPQKRGGIGLKTFNITRKTGPVAAAQIVDAAREVYVVSRKAQVLRTNMSEISNIGRATQGVRVFKLESGDSVASITAVDLGIQERIKAASKPNASGDRNGRNPAR